MVNKPCASRIWACSDHVSCKLARTDFMDADDAQVKSIRTGHRGAAGHGAVVHVDAVVGGKVDDVPGIIAVP